MGSIVVLDLMGGVALLLWGLHMVRSGIMRAFGSELRRLLSTALRNRLTALLVGIGVTALLQSSTATALMITSFASRGLVDLIPALAIMLGANIGTTLIVQVLSFNVSAVAPVLILVGVSAFKLGQRTPTRDLGRVAIGLGLMLLALHILLDALASAENTPSARALLEAIAGAPLLCVLIAAALTWATHSGPAVVLLVMPLAYSHLVTPVAALALVLGANLGSAINPVLEGGSAKNPASRRLPVGNLINRIIGVVVVLPFLQPIANAFARFEPNPARMAADFHTAFNIALALVFILLLDRLALLLVRLFPDPAKSPDPSTPFYLDETAINTPSVALVCAARETLRMGDIVESMLRKAMTALMSNDRKLAAEVSRMDNIVDRLAEEIKLYVTKVTRESLDDRDGRRAMEIISFAINLEHIGDIIDKNLMDLAVKKIKHKYELSKEGATELAAFHKRIVDNLKLAFSIFINDDVKIARTLIEEKTQLRTAELAFADSHFARLREGRPESIETSSLHLDVLRDLKRIHSHICSVAYPVLEAAGELQPSGLRD
jgi:phosphate:Na+ symporter